MIAWLMILDLFKYERPSLNLSIASSALLSMRHETNVV
mgnify:CR=1 FL=1